MLPGRATSQISIQIWMLSDSPALTGFHSEKTKIFNRNGLGKSKSCSNAWFNHRTVKYGNQFGSQLGPVELGKVVQKLFPEESFDEWLNTLHILNDNQEPPNQSRSSSESEGGVRIGFVGHTNVGKSSIMNTLVGEKHFSMSIRPGHTKTLQTWEVASNVTLIDSPGIIFPSYYPKELQGKND